MSNAQFESQLLLWGVQLRGICNPGALCHERHDFIIFQIPSHLSLLGEVWYTYIVINVLNNDGKSNIPFTHLENLFCLCASNDGLPMDLCNGSFSYFLLFLNLPFSFLLQNHQVLSTCFVAWRMKWKYRGWERRVVVVVVDRGFFVVVLCVCVVLFVVFLVVVVGWGFSFACLLLLWLLFYSQIYSNHVGKNFPEKLREGPNARLVHCCCIRTRA